MAETRSGFSTIGAIAVAAVLIFATTGQYAFGDNVVNDVAGTPAEATITAGDSLTVNYRIVATGGPSPEPAGCNVDSSNPAQVTINTVAGVSVTGSPLNFTECSVVQSVTFSSNTAGDYSIPAVSVTGGKTGSSWNTNPTTFTLHVLAAPPSDTTPPVITPNIAGTLGNNGWYVSDVTVSWTVVDEESDISSTTGCDPTTIDTDTAGTTLTCSATSAGGTSSESVTIKRDATDPDVALVGSLLDDTTYYYGFVPGEPTCTASDAMSGLVTPPDCTVSGYATSVGTHTVTANAEDMAGNTNSDSHTYAVNSWTLNGFFKPVDMEGIFNVIKGGQTVPLKFQIFAGTTELTDAAYVDSLKYKKIACPSNGDYDPIEGDALTTGGTMLRYDADSGQFIYNWKTPTNKNSCWEVTLTTDDGSTLMAKFQTK